MTNEIASLKGEHRFNINQPPRGSYTIRVPLSGRNFGAIVRDRDLRGQLNQIEDQIETVPPIGHDRLGDVF